MSKSALNKVRITYPHKGTFPIVFEIDGVEIGAKDFTIYQTVDSYPEVSVTFCAEGIESIILGESL